MLFVTQPKEPSRPKLGALPQATVLRVHALAALVTSVRIIKKIWMIFQ